MVSNETPIEDLEETDDHGWTALHWSIVGGDLVTVKAILQAHQQLLLQQDKEGWTPLHLAVSRGRANIVPLLLSLKASVDMLAPRGKTALEYAEELGHEAITKLLKEAAINSAESHQEERQGGGKAAIPVNNRIKELEGELEAMKQRNATLEKENIVMSARLKDLEALLLDDGDEF